VGVRKAVGVVVVVDGGVEVTVVVWDALGDDGLAVPTGSTVFTVAATCVSSLDWFGVGVIPFSGSTQEESASNKAAATSRGGKKADPRRFEPLDPFLFTNSSRIYSFQFSPAKSLHNFT